LPPCDPRPLGERLRRRGTLLSAGRGRRPAASPREDRTVACGHDVRAEPWAPELDERRVLPAGRLSPVDTRVDRQQRGSRHAVLEPGARRTPQRPRAAWQPLVERPNPPSEREDLRRVKSRGAPTSDLHWASDIPTPCTSKQGSRSRSDHRAREPDSPDCVTRRLRTLRGDRPRRRRA
jgi:hypothetical protein